MSLSRNRSSPRKTRHWTTHNFEILFTLVTKVGQLFVFSINAIPNHRNVENSILLEACKTIQTALSNLKVNSEGIVKKRKCRYYNRGYCKFGENCDFVHPSHICDTFLKDGACSSRECQQRHPKDCRYWTKKPEGCTRKDSCQYLHRESRKYSYSEIEKRITGDSCEYKASENEDINYHIQTEHSNIFSCDICDFTSSRQFKQTIQKFNTYRQGLNRERWT